MNDSLESQVFRKYFSELCHAISDPEWLASELFSKDLISNDALDDAVTTMGISRTYKTRRLLCHFERTLSTNRECFQKFIYILKSAKHLDLIANKVLATYECAVAESDIKGGENTLSFTEETTSEPHLPCSSDLPSLPELLHLRVPQEVGSNYFMFGIFLLRDETGSHVDMIVDECCGKPEKVTCRILQEWIQGKGTPVTWESLVKTLRNIKLLVLADKIAANHVHCISEPQ